LPISKMANVNKPKKTNSDENPKNILPIPA
jgi:hypothetical protein